MASRSLSAATSQPGFALHGLVESGPRETRVSRRLSPAVFSIAIHLLVVAAIVVIPLVFGDQILPATSDVVRAFFVPPPEVALPPPPPPPPAAGARALKPAPVAQPSAEASFVAPIEVPDTIRPDESIDFGVEGGVPGGVEGGVPGGVVGGVVGGLPTDVPPPAEAKPIRVGGMVQAPRLITRVDPTYPALARAARTTATLILEATVGPDGRVRDVTVLRGQPLFDQPAVTAVRQWRYQPLLLNGIPVPFIVTVTLNFNIVGL